MPYCLVQLTHLCCTRAYGGEFKLNVYVNKVAYAEHIALVKGDVSDGGPVLVRMHAINLLDDVLGQLGSGKAGELQAAMELIGREERGVIVLIREPRPTSLSEQVGIRAARERGEAVTVPSTLRDYGIGAQILVDLGITEMTLLSNTKKTIVGLDGYGLKVVEQRPIPVK